MPNKEEYPKLQRSILQLLFDKAEAVAFTTLMEHIKKPESETQYHCDVLEGQKVIVRDSVSLASGRSLRGYSVTATGRKQIMEN